MRVRQGCGVVVCVLFLIVFYRSGFLRRTGDILGPVGRGDFVPPIPWLHAAFGASGNDTVDDEDLFVNTQTPNGGLTNLTTEEVTRPPVQVLLLAYFRSGSTFTGALIDQAAGSFYRYEPLHAVYYMIKERRVLRFINGTISSPYKEENKTQISVDVVRSFLDCNFNNTPEQLLTEGFAGRTRQTKVLLECLRSKEKDCFSSYVKECHQARLRAVKVIRFRMSSLTELLKAIPRLKVIHLFRDPRGEFVSAHKYSSQPIDEIGPSICQNVLGDIKLRQQLEKTMPDRFLQIIYEDLAQHPMEIAEDIYRFLGMRFSDNVQEWVRTSTSGDVDTEGLGTTKINSTETAYKWTGRIGWKYVQYFQESCSELLRWGRFPFIQSEDELRNFTIPVRPRATTTPV